jgi:2-keto-4-pentenoate hydratase/2-oxohepta-3-ene-1,7-dioic acid hydratase in catechol pathway
VRYARIRHAGDEVWVVADGDQARLLDGDPIAGDAQPTGEAVALADAELLIPVSPSKIFCLGRNYSEHVLEMGYETPTTPSIFLKPPTTLIGPGQDVVLPRTDLSDEVEHEAELAVVIGRVTRNVSEADALDYVFGFTCSDDVSARDLQRLDPNNTRGKGFDTFLPVGPWIETDLDLSTPQSVRARVNGELRQDGHTGQMIYSVPFIISFLSQFSTLLPGDLILTGSPGGTGRLSPGDVVEIEVGGVGVLRHGVAAA